MAIIKSGILDGFRGTVGTVVGANWRGIDYMREKSHDVRNPNTEGQQEQRNKFALTIHTLRPLLDYIRIGFNEYAIKMSAFNAAVSYNIKNAIEGEYPAYTVDYSKMKVARGGLTMVDDASVTASEGKFTFAWTDNSGIGSAKGTDVALPLVYNPEKRVCIFGTSPASRIEGMTDVSVPSTWSGTTCVLFLAFQSVDGSAVSDSMYLGEEMVM